MRALGLTTLSGLLGVLFGLIAAVVLRILVMGGMAAFLGAAVGLVLAPFLVWGLWTGPVRLGLSVIVPATAATTLLGGHLFKSLVVSAGMTALVYMLACMGYGAWLRLRADEQDRAQDRLCALCGYDLTGLEPHRCPECGSGTS